MLAAHSAGHPGIKSDISFRADSSPPARRVFLGTHGNRIDVL